MFVLQCHDFLSINSYTLVAFCEACFVSLQSWPCPRSIIQSNGSRWFPPGMCALEVCFTITKCYELTSAKIKELNLLRVFKPSTPAKCAWRSDHEWKRGDRVLTSQSQPSLHIDKELILREEKWIESGMEVLNIKQNLRGFTNWLLGRLWGRNHGPKE